MRRDTRKQPWQTFPFWFLILSGLAMTVAWKLDLLRPGTTPVASETASVEAAHSPDWATAVPAEATTEEGEQLYGELADIFATAAEALLAD